MVEPGSSACTRCPTGRTSTGGDVADPGGEEYLGETIGIDLMALCESCVAGKYKAADGAPCEDCPVGQYSADDGAACDNCDAGLYQDTAGSTACEECVAGKVSAQPISGLTMPISSCESCAAGKYQDGDGESHCMDCDRGSSSSVGASVCATCA